ncbi:MAG: pantoate--beta-alanine ligase [Ferruginibacter sp.]
MIIFKSATDISRYLIQQNQQGIRNAFVPTMGALHDGHIALIKKARAENKLVTCSIFVNPTQFNDPRDFKKYPHTIEQDILLLAKAGCDVLFLPSVETMYPDGLENKLHYQLGDLENKLEGKYRPGHYQGVCQVVHRLLNIVKPAKLYLGQKDFQQCMILKRLVEIIGLNTQVIVCPTRREPGGLAMSSRNMRLSIDEKKQATAIFEVLNSIKENIKNKDLDVLKNEAIHTLNQKGFKVDYVAIASTDDLNEVKKYDDNYTLIALVAAYLNEVRLIDNMLLND